LSRRRDAGSSLVPEMNMRGFPHLLAGCAAGGLLGRNRATRRVLTTQLSATSARLGDSIHVTLNASNPTDTTVRFIYTNPTTFATFTLGSVTSGDAPVFVYAGVDTVVMTAGGVTTLGTATVDFGTVSGGATPLSAEHVALTPGQYLARACVFNASLKSASAVGDSVRRPHVLSRCASAQSSSRSHCSAARPV
jgi:hypothetical protein